MFLVNKIVFLLNFIFAGALLLGHIAAGTDPEVFWPIAFFGLAYPFLLIANAVFVVYWLIFKKLRFIISLSLIVFGWGKVSNVVQLSGDNIERTDAMIRVVSYNTKNMARYDYHESSYPEFLNLLDTIKPDIMCLQEFFAFTYENENSAKLLDKQYGLKYQKMKYTNRYGNYGDYGHAILSRYPIIHSEELAFNTNKTNSCIYIDIVKNGDTIRVYSVHLQSIGFEENDYEFITNINEDEEAVVKSQSIIYRLRSAFIKRAQQAKLVRASIESSPYPVIVCGDFNDSPTSYAYSKIKGNMKDAFRESGSGFGKTYVGKMPSFKIDHILFDKSMDGFNYTTFDGLKSDHKLIMTDLLPR